MEIFKNRIVKNISEQTQTKITDLINISKQIVIIGHNNPDGDAAGACLGLYKCLKIAGKDVQVILPNDVPSFLKWLPGYQNVLIHKFNPDVAKRKLKDADVIFCIDFNSLERIEGMGDSLMESPAKKVIIDHHPDPDKNVDFLFSDTSKSSASEIVFDFIKLTGLFKFFDIDASVCLYTGIMTDTINFSVNSSNRETFDIISELLAFGINKDDIYNRVYNSYSLDRIKLVGWVLYEKLKLIDNTGVAYIIIALDELNRFNFKNGDQEGIVNIPLSAYEVNTSILAMEKDDHIKLSLRSKNNVDVNSLAKIYFNGGGHINAAGGKIFVKLEETENYIINAVKDFLK